MDSSWAIGDLANAAGVTVRTLRYYEQIGLLSASDRSSGLHRRYSDADVERLYQIVAMRSLGLSLEAIGAALSNAGPGVLDLINQQLVHVDERIQRDEQLSRRLRSIANAIPVVGHPSAGTLLDVMEMITMTDSLARRVERLLRSAGHLASGQITSLTEAAGGDGGSHVTHLRIGYSADATPSEPPTDLVLKENLPVAWAVAGGAQEVTFYRTVRGLPDHPPILATCYGADYSMVKGDSQILLADLSATHHRATPDRDAEVAGDVPALETCEQVVDTLADLHAYWWDHPLLRDGVFPLLDFNADETRWCGYEQHRRTSWEAVSTDPSSPVPGGSRRVLDEVFASFGSHWDGFMRDRVSDRRRLTLMHGDAYFVNFLVPATAGAGPAMLLDWQCPTGNIGAFDLANLLATFWTNSQRHEANRELTLLHRYHDRLVASGVIDYSWAELADDYRAAIIYWLLVPIQDAYDGAAPSYWTPKLDCLAQAFDDWNCRALL